MNKENFTLKLKIKYVEIVNKIQMNYENTERTFNYF